MSFYSDEERTRCTESGCRNTGVPPDYTICMDHYEELIKGLNTQNGILAKSEEDISKETIVQVLLDEYNSWEGCKDPTVLSNVHEVLYNISERLNLIDTFDFSPQTSITN